MPARTRSGSIAGERTLKVVAASSPAPAPPATPPQFDCVHAANVSLEATLSADRVQRGQTLPFSIRNTSDGCVTMGVGYQLEYQARRRPVEARAVAADLPDDRRDPAAGRGVPQQHRTIPADAPLGLYRLVGYTGFTEPTFEVVA